jgi:uncharacterized membrane protein YagU involved in acid resistance
MRHPALTAIVVGGIVAGTLDIGAAALINMASPMRILHFVAGGLRGRDALQGGTSMTLLGIALQGAMSLVIAAIYVAACQQWRALHRRWITAGLAYGVVVFVVMNYIVVPLSAWGRAPAFTYAGFAENLLAMLLFGLIVSFAARRYAPKT